MLDPLGIDAFVCRAETPATPATPSLAARILLSQYTPSARLQQQHGLEQESTLTADGEREAYTYI